jgi:hypothetical protein
LGVRLERRRNGDEPPSRQHRRNCKHRVHATNELEERVGPVTIEFVGFATLSQLILHTDLFEVPNDPASFGVAFLAFAAFFTIQGGIVVFQRLHS